MLLAVFIERPTPFVGVFFERLLELRYPKNRLKLLIFNKVFDTFPTFSYLESQERPVGWSGGGSDTDLGLALPAANAPALLPSRSRDWLARRSSNDTVAQRGANCGPGATCGPVS